ncbi:hypothetical protein CRYUN_Cryun15aG0052100 [Craigia yunnanensis]
MAANQEPEPSWQELLGSKNWDSLLDPLYLLLRKLILRCGDFCQATYDAFNNDQNSKFCGTSRYGKSSFFDKVMLESASDYRVESFLYATARVSLPEAFLLHSKSRESWDRESNWIGYIATTSDETTKALGRREIYVVWRGTARDYDFVFGCPQVGNKAFDERMKRYPNLTVLHIKNTIDLIPHYPSQLLGYVYTGTELVIDTRKSPSLKHSKNPSDWHNLQAMLHIVAGWNGEKGEFELKVKKSLALVNKSCAFLKDECLVPESWWVEKNKGLVRNEDGEWVTALPTDEDLPTPEI